MMKWVRKGFTDLLDSPPPPPATGSANAADYAFASMYFGRPVRQPGNLDGALPTSPATTYLDHSFSSPPTSAAESLTFRSPSASHSSGSDENNPFSPTPAPARGNALAIQRRSISLFNPNTPEISTPYTVQPQPFGYIEGLGQRPSTGSQCVDSRTGAEREGHASGSMSYRRMPARPRAASAAVPASSRMPDSLTIVEEESDWEDGA